MHAFWHISLYATLVSCYLVGYLEATQGKFYICLKESQISSAKCLSLCPLAEYHNLVCEVMAKRRSLKQIKAGRLMEVV